jgi:hypothetical protein
MNKYYQTMLRLHLNTRGNGKLSWLTAEGMEVIHTSTARNKTFSLDFRNATDQGWVTPLTTTDATMNISRGMRSQKIWLQTYIQHYLY